MKQRQITKNIVYSVAAQAVCLLASLLVGLVVPKFIDEYQYAYWQIYALYVGYVGILHFGIIDGLVLRYSQYDYDELNKPVIRSQFYILLLIDSLLALVFALVSSITVGGIIKQVMLFVAIGIITKNVFTYSSYLLQITNRIKKYACLVVIHRLVYGIMIMLLLVLRVNNFAWFCIVDLLSDCFAIAYGFICSKKLYIGKPLAITEAFRETWLSATSGIFVLVANLSSNLLIGSGKMIVQWRWDELLFGKISFAFSVLNLFLTFVSAISLVLFPSIKRMDQGELPALYKKVRGAVSPILFIAMLFYFPGCWILKIWLPTYTTSLTYLGILLPIIVYTSKVSLLTNNYLKAYRKEKLMLYINLSSIVVGIAFYIISAYIFNNITTLLMCIVVVIVMRSILSEVVVMKTIKIRIFAEFIIEAFMTVIFILSANCFGLLIGGCIYGCALVAYFIYNRNNLTVILSKSLKRRTNQ